MSGLSAAMGRTNAKRGSDDPTRSPDGFVTRSFPDPAKGGVGANVMIETKTDGKNYRSFPRGRLAMAVLLGSRESSRQQGPTAKQIIGANTGRATSEACAHQYHRRHRLYLARQIIVVRGSGAMKHSSAVT
jgi:hypothetical protein